MKSFGLAAVLLPMIALAAPSSMDRRQDVPEVSVTFQGAPPETVYYQQSFPVDGNTYQITNDPNSISVSHIVVDGGANCEFWGSEGSYTFVTGGVGPVDVGPPQVQVAGLCNPA